MGEALEGNNISRVFIFTLSAGIIYGFNALQMAKNRFYYTRS